MIADPLVAKGLVDLGFKTKEDVADWLQKNSTISAKDARTTLFGGRLAQGLPDDAMVPRWQRASDIHIVVVGGQTNPYHMVANMRYAVSISIDKWA